MKKKIFLFICIIWFTSNIMYSIQQRIVVNFNNISIQMVIESINKYSQMEYVLPENVSDNIIFYSKTELPLELVIESFEKYLYAKGYKINIRNNKKYILPPDKTVSNIICRTIQLENFKVDILYNLIRRKLELEGIKTLYDKFNNTITLIGEDETVFINEKLLIDLTTLETDKLLDIDKILLNNSNADLVYNIVTEILKGIRRVMDSPQRTAVSPYMEEYYFLIDEGLERLHIIPSFQENSIIVISDSKNTLKLMRELITKIDRRQPDMMNWQTKIIPVTTSNINNIAHTLTRLIDENRNIISVLEKSHGQHISNIRGKNLNYVTVVPDITTNSLILMAPDIEQIQIIENLVKKLSDITTTSTEEVFVYYVKHSNAVMLSRNLSNLLEKQVDDRNRRPSSSAQEIELHRLLGNVKMVPDPETNSIIFITSRDNYNSIKSILTKLDIRPTQVLIEAMIIEITLEDEKDIGVDWSKFPGRLEMQHSTGTGFSYNIVSNMQDIKSFVDVLKKNYKYNVISTPKITTSNNKTATITVAEEIPFLTGKYDKVGEATQYTYQYGDVGVTLEVKPHINNDDDIALELTQTIRAALNKTLYDAPFISKREAQTTVVLKDGQPLVIGGIMQQQTSTVKTKVPGLGNIPVLGNLFKRDTLQDIKTELVIIITPVLIKSEEVAKQIYDNEHRLLNF